jgi:hypothetical protein
VSPSPPGAARWLSPLSWALLALAALAAAGALLAHWAIDAPSLGAKDAGLALSLAFAGSALLIVTTYAAPLLALAGLGVLALHPRSGLRLLAEATLAGLPVALLTLLGR